jgi:hypothetical protein
MITNRGLLVGNPVVGNGKQRYRRMTLPDSGAQIINFIEPHVTATEETSVILNGLV